MKISASIYSNKNKPLLDLITDLSAASVDYFHVDCKNNKAVFEDIAAIRQVSNIPIDLHIIASEYESFLPMIEKYEIEMVSLQLEDTAFLPEISNFNKTKFGIAITSKTPVKSIENELQKGYQYVMLMATEPGVSGGKFNPINFQRINEIHYLFPKLKIQVDGGVDHEIGFVLRLLGVDSIVSGSYLVNNGSATENMLTFYKPQLSAEILVKDFFVPTNQLPILHENQFDFFTALQKIEDYKQGFALVENESKQLAGVITNADVRRFLLAQKSFTFSEKSTHFINKNPLAISEKCSVYELWNFIQELPFIVLFLPVINEQNELQGALLLNQLTRG